VGLDVAAQACVQVSLGLERVVAGLPRWVAPEALRRVEAAAVLGVRRRIVDADAEVALEAEALLAVAALAALRFHPSFDRMHVQIIVRMYRAGPHPSVVAVGAEVFL